MSLDRVKADRFIEETMKYLGDTYSMQKRMVKGFSDCSSLIYKGLRDSNLLTNASRTVSTKYMRDGDPRFRQINMSQAKRGDILWYQRPGTNDSNYFGHVAILLDDKQVIEAIKPKVAITSRYRIQYQRAYRIKALEATNLVAPKVSKLDRIGEVTANVLNVRNHDSVKGQILGTLKRNDEVKITGQTQTKWYEIEHKGSKAYVSNAYVKLVKTAIENIDILINGKLVKKGYIIDGVTFATINGQDVPVRKVFENIGAKVEWRNKRVEITL